MEVIVRFVLIAVFVVVLVVETKGREAISDDRQRMSLFPAPSQKCVFR